ncbi:hypothetical protein [Amycolatopsis sp. 195334CR]|uniref:hypothetical protein n=1 Tax=Amycolatopsis sp. 195334CR TaxID=2814588 RepID=UPI001A8D04EC|nr:hypothetical protein [Amycolatopsis sp. 195334CR]MBN6039991.1 hypothetical protein [Amycolatopsis sp. 195334CR]
MAGYDAQIDTITKAGEAAQEVSEVITSLNSSGRVPDGTAAMPGSPAVAKLEELRSSWQAAEQACSQKLQDHASNLLAAAAMYRDREDAVVAELRGIVVHQPDTEGPR